MIASTPFLSFLLLPNFELKLIDCLPVRRTSGLDRPLNCPFATLPRGIRQGFDFVGTNQSRHFAQRQPRLDIGRFIHCACFGSSFEPRSARRLRSFVFFLPLSLFVFSCPRLSLHQSNANGSTSSDHVVFHFLHEQSTTKRSSARSSVLSRAFFPRDRMRRSSQRSFSLSNVFARIKCVAQPFLFRYKEKSDEARVLALHLDLLLTDLFYSFHNSSLKPPIGGIPPALRRYDCLLHPDSNRIPSTLGLVSLAVVFQPPNLLLPCCFYDLSRSLSTRPRFVAPTPSFGASYPAPECAEKTATEFGREAAEGFGGFHAGLDLPLALYLFFIFFSFAINHLVLFILVVFSLDRPRTRRGNRSSLRPTPHLSQHQDNPSSPAFLWTKFLLGASSPCDVPRDPLGQARAVPLVGVRPDAHGSGYSRSTFGPKGTRAGRGRVV